MLWYDDGGIEEHWENRGSNSLRHVSLGIFFARKMAQANLEGKADEGLGGRREGNLLRHWLVNMRGGGATRRADKGSECVVGPRSPRLIN